jgi:hypothetical protein
VVGGVAPPEIVVVHGRQVIVDEGIGMDHLHGTGRGKRPRHFPPHRLAGGQHENGTDPLAAGEHRIAHGFMEGDGKLVLPGKKAVESLVHQLAAFFKVFLQVHGASLYINNLTTKMIVHEPHENNTKKDYNRQ